VHDDILSLFVGGTNFKRTRHSMMSSTNSIHPLLWSTATTLGNEAFAKVTSSKILLVGSGGIGCELLKNLALSGFKDVQVIDLDTIDVSNLNRQFLFRSQHVGKSKCLVATAASADMAPVPVNYVPHHGNVKSQKFNVSFFKQFDAVLNALDNVDARRHVNRLCLASDIPLIEAGTTGYLGQTTVISRGATECYECQPKPTRKVYPICTIRSTPSQPVHCIVWAKELFTLMFYHGDPKDKSMLYEDEENVEESTYMDAVVRRRPKSNNEIAKYVKDTLVALYITEVQKQIDMDKYKGSKNPPKPLNLSEIEAGLLLDIQGAPSNAFKKRDYQSNVWTVSQCVAQILSCTSAYYESCKFSSKLMQEFDKDDGVAMDFVTAASNLRAHIFGIENKSLHDAKGIAGNIVPAIATTNAIVAGLQVLELFKILKHKDSNDASNENLKQYIKEHCRYTYCLRDKTRKGYYLLPTKLPSPSDECFVCRKASLTIIINTKEFSLKDLLDKVIKKRLGFNEPTIMIGGEDGSIIYEEGDGADETFIVNLPKKLAQLPCGGLIDGSSFAVEDFTQDMEVEMIVTHRDEWDEKKEPDGFIIVGGNDKMAAAARAGASKEGNVESKKANGNGSHDNGVTERNPKRPNSEDIDSSSVPAQNLADEQPPSKKLKIDNVEEVDGSNDNEIIEIE